MSKPWPRSFAAAAGRPSGADRPPPDLAAEFFSLAATSPAARRVRGPEVATLVAQARPMAALVVGAYLGPAAADELPAGAAAAPAPT